MSSTLMMRAGIDVERCQRTMALDVMKGLLDELHPWVESLEVMRPESQEKATLIVPGSTFKLMAYDQDQQPYAVAICSSPIEPEVVAMGVERAREARQALGSLGDVVLEPLRSGTMNGLSYAVYPYCRAFSQSRYGWIIQRIWVRPQILRWLRAATQRTLYSPTAEEQDEKFHAPLVQLADLDGLPEPVRTAAVPALERLERGAWSPKCCLMHGDFWKGNLLRPPGTRGWNQFVLIDWPGSSVRGYGILDLVASAATLRLKGERLRREVAAHCRILGCEWTDARSYLLAALGHLEANRGNFPWERFTVLAETLWNRLISIGA